MFMETSWCLIKFNVRFEDWLKAKRFAWGFHEWKFAGGGQDSIYEASSIKTVGHGLYLLVQKYLAMF